MRKAYAHPSKAPHQIPMLALGSIPNGSCFILVERSPYNGAIILSEQEGGYRGRTLTIRKDAAQSLVDTIRRGLVS